MDEIEAQRERLGAVQSAQSYYFPPVTAANREGLLMVGGDLSVGRLVEAYRRGIFPWPVVEGGVEILSWWCPDPRAILELDQLHVPRRLQRKLRSGRFRLTIDRSFEAVIRACAEPRREGGGTWITPAMQRAYTQLHEAGYAHSVEAWCGGQLAGGVYGVALGGYFAGESMFYRVPDASKAALVHLVGHLRTRGFELFDIQQWSPHLAQLGATEIPRQTFLQRLKRAVALPVSFSERAADQQE